MMLRPPLFEPVRPDIYVLSASRLLKTVGLCTPRPRNCYATPPNAVLRHALQLFLH